MNGWSIPSSLNRVSVLVIALAQVVASPLWAQEEAVSESLTLKTVIALTLQHNHDIKVGDWDALIELEKIKVAMLAFDPRLEGSYAYQSIDSPQNAQDYVATGGSTASPTNPAQPSLTEPKIFQQRNKVSKLGLTNKFQTGTTVELSSTMRVLDNTLNRRFPPSLFNPEWETFTGITLTQPLLRDWGIRANTAEIRIAKANAQGTDIEWHALVAQTVAETMKRYYDVVFTLRNMEVQREGVDLAQKLMDDTQKRSNEGVAAANDVMVAESGVSQRREEALAAEMQYIERQNALQMLFKSAGEVIAQGSRIQPVDGMSETVPATNREALMATAVERRYEIKQANAVIMAKSAQVDFARNQAKPRIDLVANGGYHGLAGNFGDSYSRAADGQGPEWSIGMQVSIPLGLNNMKAVRRAAEDQRTQAHVQLDKTKLRVALEVDTVLSRLRMDVQRLEATKKSREAAAQSAEGELKRLTEGVSTSYQVLQLQKEFSQARSRELAALADINKDIVDLQLTTGTLLEEQDVVVESTAAATRNEFDGVPAVTNPVRDQWLAGPEAVMPDNAAMSDNAVMPDNAAMPDKAAKPPVPAKSVKAKSVKAKTASPSASRIK